MSLRNRIFTDSIHHLVIILLGLRMMLLRLAFRARAAASHWGLGHLELIKKFVARRIFRSRSLVSKRGCLFGFSLGESSDLRITCSPHIWSLYIWNLNFWVSKTALPRSQKRLLRVQNLRKTSRLVLLVNDCLSRILEASAKLGNPCTSQLLTSLSDIFGDVLQQWGCRLRRLMLQNWALHERGQSSWWLEDSFDDFFGWRSAEIWHGVVHDFATKLLLLLRRRWLLVVPHYHWSCLGRIILLFLEIGQEVGHILILCLSYTATFLRQCSVHESAIITHFVVSVVHRCVMRLFCGKFLLMLLGTNQCVTLILGGLGLLEWRLRLEMALLLARAPVHWQLVRLSTMMVLRGLCVLAVWQRLLSLSFGAIKIATHIVPCCIVVVTDDFDIAPAVVSAVLTHY